MDRLLSFITYSIPIILFLVFCAKKTTRALWVIFFYLLFSFAFDILQASSSFGKGNKHEIWGLYTICEFVFFACFYYIALESPSLKRFILIGSPLILLFIIISYIKSDKNDFDSTSASVESITLIIFSIMYFFEQINRPQTLFIYSSPNFWVVLGILIYMSSVLFLFIIGIISPKQAYKYWIINNVSNFITNIIFCIAFVRNKYAFSDPSLEKSSF